MELYTVSRQKVGADTRARILDAGLRLLTMRGGAEVTMAEIAKATGISRQAVYLHFADRAELLVALVRHADEKRDLASSLKRLFSAANAVQALQIAAQVQAEMNPKIWAAARAVDAVRRHDEAAERSWQDRLANRLNNCQRIIDWLQREGSLRPGLPPETAAELLWAITSLHTWEDLVLGRKWGAKKYEQHVAETLVRALTA
jgi:AcrR family transcriptional regulator